MPWPPRPRAQTRKGKGQSWRIFWVGILRTPVKRTKASNPYPTSMTCITKAPVVLGSMSTCPPPSVLSKEERRKTSTTLITSSKLATNLTSLSKKRPPSSLNSLYPTQTPTPTLTQVLIPCIMVAWMAQLLYQELSRGSDKTNMFQGSN